MSSESPKKFPIHLRGYHRPPCNGDDARLAAILEDHREALNATRHGVIVRTLIRRFYRHWPECRRNIEDMLSDALAKAVSLPPDVPERVARNRIQSHMEGRLNYLRALVRPSLRKNRNLVKQGESAVYDAEPGRDSLVTFDREHARALARTDPATGTRLAYLDALDAPARPGDSLLTREIERAILTPVPALPLVSGRAVKDKRVYRTRHAYGEEPRFMSVVDFAQDGQQPVSSYRYHRDLTEAQAHLSQYLPDSDGSTWRYPTNRELAEQFGVTEKTIDRHVKALEKKIYEKSQDPPDLASRM